MSTGYLLRILKPTTIRVWREKGGRASMGDSAEALVAPGMVDLLASSVAGSTMPLGAGALPETMIALSIAASAAYLALGDDERKDRSFNWAGGELELTWARPARRGETLIGRARLREMRRFALHVEVETSVAETREVLMTGEIRFVAIRAGRAVRLRNSLLLLEQPAAGRGGEKWLAQRSRRVVRALVSLGRAFRRVCVR